MEQRPNIVQITPFIHVDDLAASVAFYSEILGFSCFVNGGGYAYLERDRVAIRLLEREEPGRGTSAVQIVCYIDVLNVELVANELRSRLEGIDADRWHGPKDTNYGMRELSVRDPDGHLVIFGQGIKENADQWDYRA